MRHPVAVIVVALAIVGVACTERRAGPEAPPVTTASADDSRTDSAPATTSPTATIAAPAPLASGSPACKPRLDAIRALRFGPQPCRARTDCVVWINGAYWDGCPTEVNATNGRKLDELRGAYEGAGCSVETNVSCAAKQIRGCVNGQCGGS